MSPVVFMFSMEDIKKFTIRVQNEILSNIYEEDELFLYQHAFKIQFIKTIKHS